MVQISVCLQLSPCSVSLTTLAQPGPETKQTNPTHQRDRHHDEAKAKEQLENDDGWQQRQSDQLQQNSKSMSHQLGSSST